MRAQNEGPSPPPSIRVLPVSEVRLYREGLASHLAGRERLQVVGAAASRKEALTLVASTRPDVVVIDMSTRDSLAIVREIRSVAPAVRILAFAVETLDSEILECAEAGVAGYVPGEASADDLVDAIESVMRGELICPPRTTAVLLRRLASASRSGHEQATSAGLTEREREIATLIDGGLSNKEIAQRLRIGVATVKNHVHNILEKLHVTSRAQAAAHLRRESHSVARDHT